MRLALVTVVFGLVGCIPSNVVAPHDRAVQLPADALPWRPAQAADLPGLWESEQLAGGVAASLLRVYYWIDADGEFSGAALLSTVPVRFEVLSGHWQLTDAQLRLGEDAAPAAVATAPGWLRLRGPDGEVVLHRRDPQ